MLPEINQEAYQTFWYWINERQKVWSRKYNGYPKPWSDDPIFQEWKFCNVFRRLDKQSQFLIERVINPHKADNQADLLFNIFLFRAFNWWDTYKLLGWQDNFRYTEALRILTQQRMRQEKLTSGAYMIRGRQGFPKYHSILMTVDKVWSERQTLLEIVQQNNSIQTATKTISNGNFWGWSDFTAYQVALDLTYSPIMPKPSDLNEWCAFGPGAARGIRLIFPDLEKSRFLEMAMFLWRAQDRHLETHVPSMTLQDIEFSLCELSKYMRIKNGGKSKEKYDGWRIEVA